MGKLTYEQYLKDNIAELKVIRAKLQELSSNPQKTFALEQALLYIREELQFAEKAHSILENHNREG